MSQKNTPKIAPLNNPDLEKARDEKCEPLARGILQDMATDLIPENPHEKIDYRPITVKVLKRTLEADTNLTTENTYLFQLLLGVLSGLNATVQTCTTLPIDDVRYAGIGRKILEILANSNVKIVGLGEAQVPVEFSLIKDQINELFANEKLTMLEVKYIMDNMFESFTALNNGFSTSVEQSMARAEAKLFGIEAMSDVSMGLLDKVLKAEMNSEEATETTA